MSAQGSGAPSSGPATGSVAGKGSILVVDDDRLVLATVVHGLSQAGYQVIDADNGDDAILLAREHRPELALLDIRMEGKSGFDVAETLRDAYGIPFMFLSAFADEATLAQVQALGAVDSLIKPLDVGQIVPSVDAAFARLRSGGAPAAAPAAAPLPPTVDSVATALTNSVTNPLINPVPLAVGVLMHRHSLSRNDAWRRLQRMAADQKMSLQAQSERLLSAVEELARTG
jgi:response regulator NasT